MGHFYVCVIEGSNKEADKHSYHHLDRVVTKHPGVMGVFSSDPAPTKDRLLVIPGTGIIAASHLGC
jgi:hypothetical protein